MNTGPGQQRLSDLRWFTLRFDTVPTGKEIYNAMLTTGVSAWRSIWTSADKLLCEIQEVDLRELQQRTTTETSVSTYTLEATVHCTNCSHRYRGWITVGRSHWDKDHRFHWTTYYCPHCPPVQEDTWLLDKLSIQKEKPDLPTAPSRTTRQASFITLNIDLDQLE